MKETYQRRLPKRPTKETYQKRPTKETYQKDRDISRETNTIDQQKRPEKEMRICQKRPTKETYQSDPPKRP